MSMLDMTLEEILKTRDSNIANRLMHMAIRFVNDIDRVRGCELYGSQIVIYEDSPDMGYRQSIEKEVNWLPNAMKRIQDPKGFYEREGVN